MEYRQFGRTGMQASPLTLGCMNFARNTSLDDSCAIIDRALDAGINVLDTANAYSRGGSEEFVGEALKRNGRRDRVILATKVHGVMDDDDPNAHSNHRRHIIEQCEASLRRLQTDHIDLYQIHRPDAHIPIDETLRALDDLVRAGKVRYIGASTFGAWQHVDALWAAKEHGLNRFISEQPPYHILERRIERELIPMAQTYGIAIIPWSPLGGGLLAGRYRRGEAIAESARYQPDDHRVAMRRLFADATFDAIESVEALAEAKGCTVSQFALAWVVSRPGVNSAIIGPRTMGHLEDNLGALDIEITAEDSAAIDEICAPGRAVAPFYIADFGPHPHRW